MVIYLVKGAAIIIRTPSFNFIKTVSVSLEQPPSDKRETLRLHILFAYGRRKSIISFYRRARKVELFECSGTGLSGNRFSFSTEQS